MSEKETDIALALTARQVLALRNFSVREGDRQYIFFIRDWLREL